MNRVEKLKIMEEMLGQIGAMEMNGITDPFTTALQPCPTDLECFVKYHHALGHSYIGKLRQIFPNYTFTHVLGFVDLALWRSRCGHGNFCIIPLGGEYLVVARPPVINTTEFVMAAAKEFVAKTAPELLNGQEETYTIILYNAEKAMLFAVEKYIKEKGNK